MAFTLKRPRAGRKYYTVKIRLPHITVEKSTRCAKRSDARKVAERLHTEHAAAATRVPLIMAVEVLLGLRQRQRRAAGTIRVIEEKGAQLCRVMGPDTDVRGLTLADTTAYVAKRREDVSDSTIAKEMGVLRAALRYLVKLELYDRLPDSLWPPELSHSSGVGSRWLTWDEYLRVLNSLPGEWRDAYVTYVGCGLRYGELYRVEAKHIGPTLTVIGTKAGGTREVGIKPEVREVLERRAETHPSGPLWLVSRDPDTQRTLWLKHLKLACVRAGVPHASTNDLRRTFATWAAEEGVDRDVLQKWGGWSIKSEMLDRVYVQVSPKRHAKEAAKLPGRKARK